MLIVKIIYLFCYLGYVLNVPTHFSVKMFSYSVLKRVTQVTKTIVRHKNPHDHWSVIRKKVHPIDKALAHFNDFYKQVFDKQWPSIREGLLSKQKYVAVINNYGDKEETIAKLELDGALNMRTLFTLEKQYISEELEKNRRSSTLEKIFKMDRDIEMEAERALNEERINQLKKSEVKETDAGRYSLQSSLDNAEIDARRMVDSKNALSSEILNEYIPATKIKGKDDFIPESAHYQMFDSSSKFQVQIDKEYGMHFPEHLNVYCYELDNYSDFDAAKTASTGVLNYYLMDGGSILPILALDLKPGCTMLDMCAAPGGKSLLALQTLYPECVVSNDVSQSRLTRIEHVYKQFLYDLDDKWLKTGKVKLSNRDGRIIASDTFDRILVDVPCTTDRHSLRENDNNLFKPSRIKERLKLPELQSELLFNALKLVNKGGIVVYSTCSLSPIQNDGVVHMALKRLWEETNITVIVKDQTPALLQTRSVYKMGDRRLLKYGHIVLPSRTQNYGPTYFCKLQRIK